jgi:tetratricopeptide (TPR) repeat protein
MKLFAGLAIALLPFIATGASASTTQSSAWTSCKNADNNDSQIAACTSAIASGNETGANLFEAYLNRCKALEARDSPQQANAPPNSDDRTLAIADCSQAIRLKPDSADAYSWRALMYLFENEYDRAIADYGRLVILKPDSGMAFQFRGMSYLGKGEYDRAMADCSYALKIEKIPLGMTQTCIDEAKTAKARLAAGQKLGDPRAWCEGKALPQEGTRQDRQIDGCTTLIQSGEENPHDLADDYLHRADTYEVWGPQGPQHDKAIADYNETIRLNPSSAEAFEHLAMIYWVREQYERAIADFDKAIALKPSTSTLYRGQCHAALGHIALAIADFDAVIRKNPSNDEAFVRRFDSRGDAHFLKGEFQDAIHDYDNALQRWPQFPQALYGRGAAKRRNGDDTGAKVDIDAALQLKASVALDENKIGIKPGSR